MSKSTKAGGLSRVGGKETLTGYLFMLPLMVGLLVFTVYPMLDSFKQSLYSAHTQGVPVFVGLGNYDYAIRDPLLRKAFANTLIMACYTLILVVPGSFIIASLINSVPRGKNAYKVLFYLPNVTSIVAIAILFRFVFYSSEQGIVNYMLSLLGVKPVAFFNDTSWAQFTVAIMSFWQSLGSNMLICLAGLTGISRVYYEAAEVDGANKLQQWWYITLPCSRPIIAYLIIMTTMGAMKRFGDVYMIGGQNGNPGGSLRSVVLYLYTTCFESNNPNYASAIAVLLFFFILALTIINMRLVRFDNDN